jgi:hypothetical protein
MGKDGTLPAPALIGGEWFVGGASALASGILKFGEVVEVAADFLDALTAAFGITVINEVLAAVVSGFEAEGVFNGTPVLLGVAGDFGDAGHEAIDRLPLCQPIWLFNPS